jgi:aminopeptidase
MKNHSNPFASGTLIAALLFLASGTASSQETNKQASYAELAARIVRTSANVKPGEVVLIQGGTHTVPMMEELAIQAVKAGGLVTMLLDSDRFERAIYHEVPEEYLDQKPTHFAEWMKHVDVIIGLPGVEDDPAVRADVSPQRSAKINRTDQVVWDALTGGDARILWVAYPSRSEAVANHVDFNSYQKVTWQAVRADYQRISEDGNKLRQLFKAGKTAHVTSPSGTDFTFSIGTRAIVITDGITSPEKVKSPLAPERAAFLPSGSLYFAPVETSANGRVVIPRDVYHGQPLNGQSFEFVAGHMMNYKAEEGGERVQQKLAKYTGPKYVFGRIQIGLNPGARATGEPGEYHPAYAAGFVSIGIGENGFLGGDNKVTGDGFGGFNFPIENATVTIDGKVVVRDGKLTL